VAVLRPRRLQRQPLVGCSGKLSACQQPGNHGAAGAPRAAARLRRPHQPGAIWCLNTSNESCHWPLTTLTPQALPGLPPAYAGPVNHARLFDFRFRVIEVRTEPQSSLETMAPQVLPGLPPAYAGSINQAHFLVSTLN